MTGQLNIFNDSGLSPLAAPTRQSMAPAAPPVALAVTPEAVSAADPAGSPEQGSEGDSPVRRVSTQLPSSSSASSPSEHVCEECGSTVAVFFGCCAACFNAWRAA